MVRRCCIYARVDKRVACPTRRCGSVLYRKGLGTLGIVVGRFFVTLVGTGFVDLLCIL